MIGNGIVAGLHPEQIRDMIPKDTWVAFKGWSDAHSPTEAGAGAMTSGDYKELVRRVDGN